MDDFTDVEAIAFEVQGDWLYIHIYTDGKRRSKLRLPFRFFIDAVGDWLHGIKKAYQIAEQNLGD